MSDYSTLIIQPSLINQLA